MTIDQLAERIRDARAWLPGKRVALDFGEDGALLIDGVNGEVRPAAEQADTTIGISWTNWLALSQGQLDPVSAFMSGRLRVTGDINNAMQLASQFSHQRG